jgi:hypothetical protein
MRLEVGGALCRPRRLVLPPSSSSFRSPAPLLVLVLFPIISPHRFGPPVPPSVLSFPHSCTPYSPTSSRSRRWWGVLVVGGIVALVVGVGGPGWRVRFVVPLSSSPVVLARLGTGGGRGGIAFSACRSRLPSPSNTRHPPCEKLLAGMGGDSRSFIVVGGCATRSGGSGARRRRCRCRLHTLTIHPTSRGS